MPVVCELEVREYEDGTFTIWNAAVHRPFCFNDRELVGLTRAEAEQWGPVDYVEIGGFMLDIRDQAGRH